MLKMPMLGPNWYPICAGVQKLFAGTLGQTCSYKLHDLSGDQEDPCPLEQSPIANSIHLDKLPFSVQCYESSERLSAAARQRLQLTPGREAHNISKKYSTKQKEIGDGFGVGDTYRDTKKRNGLLLVS
jgi:hypothetical protein